MASWLQLPSGRVGRIALGALAVAVALLGAWLWTLDRRIVAFLDERALPPLRIWSAPLELRAGLDIEGVRLRDRLERLGYAECVEGGLPAGCFRAGSRAFEIGLRPFSDAGKPVDARAVRLALEGSVVRGLEELPGGGPLEVAALEPERLGDYSGGVLGERGSVSLEALPDHVPKAVLAAEDARFDLHLGIDPVGLLRAALANLRGGGVLQGGSTVTQQLAKNLFLTPERTLWRKLQEAFLAVLLEVRLSKQDILETYLDSVYLGRIGSIGIHGVGQGARAFFGKEPRELDEGEAATLAGIIRSPNRDSPIRHPERATARRNQVLAAMASNGWLDEAKLALRQKSPLVVARDSQRPLRAAFFVDEVMRRVGHLGRSTLLSRGIEVHTTLDLETQRAAEEGVREGIEALEKSYPKLAKRTAPVEGAAVVIDARTGYVRGLVGGRDFTRSQFNRATRSVRQPGSAFKPFVYLAAIDDPESPLTASSRLLDEPMTLRVGNDEWSPGNYDGKFRGEVPARRALERSLNVPAVHVGERVGFDRVAELAEEVGLGRMEPVPAISLGSVEVSLLDLVGAYTVFPGAGEVMRPALIRGVVDAEGFVLYRDDVRGRRVATAAGAYVATHWLEGAVNRGTGTAVRRLGVTRPVAGKTGTTNDTKDAWFVGFTPDTVAGVWIGSDDGTPLGLTGSNGAIPVWARVARPVLSATEPAPFPIPSGVVFRDVDPVSGRLGDFLCPDTEREAFIVGTEPVVSCGGRSDEFDDRGAPEAGTLDTPRQRRRPRIEPVEEEDRPPRHRSSPPWNAIEGWIKGVFGGR